MTKGGANFTAQELALVLSHYDIGIIQRIKSLTGGSKRAPKQIIVSDKGRYFLKRRTTCKDTRTRIEFAHSVQNILIEKCFPVSKLLRTKDGNNTFLELGNYIYELFEFAMGVRFDSRIELVEDAGVRLAIFHQILKSCKFPSMSHRSSFHNSKSVREHLKKIGSDEVTSNLMTMYDNSSVNVNQFGFDKWPSEIVHGDWHPGNMLVAGDKISAVFDFDSLNLAPISTDIANGALQFSIIGGRQETSDWPDFLDETKFNAFLTGYCKANPISEDELKSLPDLMIETLIAEAVLPIAATGYFSNFSGTDFLEMIQRKCLWIKNNKQSLVDGIMSKVSLNR
ncbi:MAG: phosphotransferase [Planctomycetaceae bacterium]|nr:phosphotransferase [Planctomycetaceae bacterium]